MEADDVFHHGGGSFLQRILPRLGLLPKSRPADGERHARYRQPQQPTAHLATRHLHAARAPLNKSPKHARRMAGNAARSALTNGLPEVLLEVHLQKYLQQHCYSTLGQIVRTRRNPASQTIIPRLSQCSSRAQRHASPAIRRMSDFPGKSAKTRRFASPCRLTARLPDVGTVTALPSGLIRVAGGAILDRADGLRDCLQGAVIAYQSGKTS